MAEFKESGLVFKFDEQWTVYQLDKEADYRKVSDKVPGTKCIDFIAFDRSSGVLLFIEAKGFRGYGSRASVQDRLIGRADDITIEIAQKVRDSLGVVLGGARNSTHLCDLWQECAKHMSVNGRVQVVAWLELDASTEVMLERAKANMSTRRKELRKRLLWLTSEVDILNTKSYSNELRGVQVVID